jgi:hypothetical protein
VIRDPAVARNLIGIAAKRGGLELDLVTASGGEDRRQPHDGRRCRAPRTVRVDAPDRGSNDLGRVPARDPPLSPKRPRGAGLEAGREGLHPGALPFGSPGLARKQA